MEVRRRALPNWSRTFNRNATCTRGREIAFIAVYKIATVYSIFCNSNGVSNPPSPHPNPCSHSGVGSRYYTKLSREFSAVLRVHYPNSREDEGELLGRDEAEVVYCHEGESLDGEGPVDK